MARGSLESNGAAPAPGHVHGEVLGREARQRHQVLTARSVGHASNEVGRPLPSGPLPFAALLATSLRRYFGLQSSSSVHAYDAESTPNPLAPSTGYQGEAPPYQSELTPMQPGAATQASRAAA